MAQRRQFIRGILTGAASLAVSSEYSFANIIVPQTRRLGVALVGLGYYSTDLLHPGFS